MPCKILQDIKYATLCHGFTPIAILLLALAAISPFFHDGYDIVCEAYGILG